MHTVTTFTFVNRRQPVTEVNVQALLMSRLKYLYINEITSNVTL